MQTNYHTYKRTDNQLLFITHLSQLLTYLTGFGGLIAPLIIWATQKESVDGMDEHGKSIINFQLSMIVYFIISIILIPVFLIGVLPLMLVCVLSFIMPIINAVKASNGELSSYPLSLSFIS